MEENVSYVKLINIQIDNQTFQEPRPQPTIEFIWDDAPQEPHPIEAVHPAPPRNPFDTGAPPTRAQGMTTATLNQIYQTYINNTGRGTL